MNALQLIFEHYQEFCARSLSEMKRLAGRTCATLFDPTDCDT